MIDMGFSDYYRKQIRSLNESKELTQLDAYDLHTQKALENIFNSQLIQQLRNQYIINKSFMAEQHEQDIMNGYKNKGSNPVRLATSTSDLNKLAYRYMWCMKNWPEACEAYKLRICEILLEQPYYSRMIKNDIANMQKEEQFEMDVQTASTDKYAPKERDWEKMIDYMNKKSNPERLADSCKDANKIVARLSIAKALHWENCAKEFKRRAKELNIATDAELEAYARKYANTNIPAKWQSYIDMLREGDTKGGIAQQDSKIDHNINSKLRKCLDNCIDIADYEKISDNITKIIRYDKPDIWMKFVFVNKGVSSWGRRYNVYAYIFIYDDADCDNAVQKETVYSASDMQECIDNLMQKV